MEQRVARKHHPLVIALHVPANAVLGMAWSVQGLDGDATEVERLAILGCPCHLLTVFAADDVDVLAQLGELKYVVSKTGICHDGSWEPTSSVFPPAWSQWLVNDMSDTMSLS